MNKLRYALLALALIAPLGLFAQGGSAAEGQPGPRGRRHIPNVDHQLQRLTKRLKLTGEQQPQVKAILQDEHDQMQQLWQNSSGPRAENREKMREIHETASGKIRGLLTDEQKARYDKMEAKRAARMQKHREAQSTAPAQESQPQQ